LARSLLTSSLEILIGKVAPAEVETAIEYANTEQEYDNCNWVALPVNDWVNTVVHIEETKVVGEHVEESMPGHERPVGREQLDVCVINVYPGHQQRRCVKNGHVGNHEIGRGVPLRRSFLMLNLLNQDWRQNDPEAEGDGQVEAVRHFEPCEGDDVPVLRVACCQQGQDLRYDGIAPTPVRPVVEEVHVLSLVSHEA